jgi:hypothetical protein
MEFAKSKIKDVILGTEDLLRKVISKISFRLISAALLGFVGRRSFHSINYNSIYNWKGKQNLINMSVSGEPPRINLILLFVKPTAGGLVNYDLKSRIRPLLVGTNVLIVKLTDISRIKFLGRAFLSTASNTPLGLELAKGNKPANIHGIITAWFITGFTDGEGTFGVYFIKKNKNLKLGMTFIPLFQIGVHKKDEELLKEIKEVGFKGIGSITYNKDMAFFKVQSLKDILTVVIPHFDKYPLMTQKRADYLLFREIAIKMSRREHLKIEGIQEILNLKASLNLGLSEADHEAFPETRPVPRPLVEPSSQIIPDPEWVSGFVSAEGCFYVGSYKVSDRSSGIRIVVRLEVAQHTRDELLMSSLISYLGCGKYEKRNSRDLGYYKVTKFADIQGKILPFFQEHKVRGVKWNDFRDWCQVVELMKEKKHLTSECMDQIIKIKAGMNKGRNWV